MTNKITDTVREAARERDQSLWKIADALLEEIDGGPGCWDDYLACAKELKALGFEGYGPGRLQNLRKVAKAFPPATRRPDISFAAHQAAGYPEMLDKDHRPSERRRGSWAW